MIHWERDDAKIPVKSWCESVEEGALRQALNLAKHPVVVGHVALMPDCHVGYGMPIGGVVACRNAVIPYGVGVDIGCGMGALRTSIPAADFRDRSLLRGLVEDLKRRIPVGEGNARTRAVPWDGIEEYLDLAGAKGAPDWYSSATRDRDERNLGTLGGGNHFIEIQEGDDGLVWLMIHSGSRNLGYRIAGHYHKTAIELDRRLGVELPDRELAYLPLDTEEGLAYVRDMNFALRYAAENRRIMMEDFRRVVLEAAPDARFDREVNIHHNYAAEETWEGERLWVHRKGATSARKGEAGIIPGSMGMASYLVEGLGNPLSFQSCSHGAGRRMGRAEACRRLDKDDCERAMGDVVFDRWKPSDVKGADKKRLPDLSEAPLAYKDIDSVIASELDLIRPVRVLKPLAVVKG